MTQVPDPKKGAPAQVTLHRLLLLARPEAKKLAWGTLFLLLGSVMSLVFPQGIRFIIDEALSGRSKHSIDQAALGMVVVFAVLGLSTALRFVLFTNAGERVVARLRGDLFASLIASGQDETINRLSRLASCVQISSVTCGMNG